MAHEHTQVPLNSWHPTKDNLKQIFQEIDDSNTNQVALNPLACSVNEKTDKTAILAGFPAESCKSHETWSQDTISKDVASMSCGVSEGLGKQIGWTVPCRWVLVRKI